MANEKWLNAKSDELEVEFRIWGERGRSIRESIEQQLDVRLGKEIANFIESVGNVSIGPFLIAVAGNDQGQMSAVTETNSVRADCPELPTHFVKVMDHAGESYFYDTDSDQVHAFDSLNIDPAMKTLSFDGFDKFLEWAFEEAKLQSEDSRFKF